MNKIQDVLKKSLVTSTEQIESPASHKKALGRGLAALIGSPEAKAYNKPVPLFSSEEIAEKNEVQYLDAEFIKSGKYQPRENFNDQMLKELIGSIQEQGVLQPILVRKIDSGFEIIAGERRFRACQSLGIKKIPAIVKNVEDRDALIISLIENIQRQELNPIEEARAFQQLMDKFSFSQDAVAKSLGKDKTTVSNILRLLKLPSEIQQNIIKGFITAGHAKVLLGVDDARKQKSLCQLIIHKSLSVRGLENLVSQAGKKRKRTNELGSSLDPYVFNCERQLQLALGTKVRILAQRKRGKIVIEYYSPEDIERIIKIITKR